MPSGLTRPCEKGGWCNWHIPAAVREHMERMEANHERLVEALKAIRDFDPEEEYNDPIDEWLKARAFDGCKALAHAVLAELEAQ